MFANAHLHEENVWRSSSPIQQIVTSLKCSVCVCCIPPYYYSGDKILDISPLRLVEIRNRPDIRCCRLLFHPALYIHTHQHIDRNIAIVVVLFQCFSMYVYSPIKMDINTKPGAAHHSDQYHSGNTQRRARRGGTI